MKPIIADIKVDNVTLTVNYYKEYLNFKVMKQDTKGMHASMLFYNNTIYIKKCVSNLKYQKIILNLNFSDKKLEQLYKAMKQKTKIIQGYNRNPEGIYEFSVKDCNENIICFKGVSCSN